MIHTLGGHTAPIQTIAFHPDGEIIASVDDLGYLKLWNVNEGKQISSKKMETHPIHQVAFDPSGKMIALGSPQQVKVIAAKGEHQTQFTIPTSPSKHASVAFSSDGVLLARVGSEHAVFLHSTKTGELVRKLQTDSPIENLAFSPDGKMIAAVGTDYAVVVWNVDSTKRLATLKGHVAPVSDLVFCPSNSRLATASRDETIRLWDLKKPAGYNEPFKGHTSAVTSIDFSSDGEWLASSGGSADIKLWSAKVCDEFTPHPRSHEQLENGCLQSSRRPFSSRRLEQRNLLI